MKLLRRTSQPIRDNWTVEPDQHPIRQRTVKEPHGGWPIVSDDVMQQAQYELSRERGESHTIAEMLALRQVPGGVSDREFMAGHCNGNEFAHCPQMGDKMAELYQRYTGKKPPVGAKYIGDLCRHGMPGDPEAWVSSRGEVKALLQRRGWGSDGLVKTRNVEPATPAIQVKLDEKLVRQEMVKQVKENPDLKKDLGELRHNIIQKHGNPRMKSEREFVQPVAPLPE